MAGVFALVVAFLAFVVPLAIPLFVQRWRSFAIVLVLGAAFFLWLDQDIQRAALGDPEGQSPTIIGAFLGGLMLVGFAGGAIAKFVMLLGRRANGPAED